MFLHSFSRLQFSTDILFSSFVFYEMHVFLSRGGQLELRSISYNNTDRSFKKYIHQSV